MGWREFGRQFSGVKKRPDLRLLLAAPGVLMAVLGVTFNGLGPLGFKLPLTVLVMAFLTAYWGIEALTAAFERSTSFLAAGRLLEGSVGALALTPGWALSLALTSSVGEEAFFRGLTLHMASLVMPMWLAVPAQALAFAALHPAPRVAWAYPLWAFFVGLLLGLIAVGCGSVLPGMLAHYLFNHLNFTSVLEGRVESKGA